MIPCKNGRKNQTQATSWSRYSAIAALLVAVVFTPVGVTKIGPYTGTQRAVYATGTTIRASLLATFVKTQIRRLWLWQVDRAFAKPIDLQSLRHLNKEWRTVLWVSSIEETFRTWYFQFSYLLAALITTAIIAGLTPQLPRESSAT